MGLFGKDPDFQPVFDNINQNRGLYESIDLPEYQDMSPELYDNETANYQLTSEDPVLRSKQLEALAQLQGLSTEGLSGVDEQGFAQARAMGDQMARGKTDAAINDAQVRGVGGGGQEFAMREMAAQAGAQRAQEAALAQKATRATQRGQYLNAFANQTAGARDQDYRANSANTDVINKFNMANTQQRNATANANVDQRNNAFTYNQNLKDKKFQNQIGKTDRMAGMNDQATQATMAQNDQNARQRQGDINTFMGLAGMGVNGMNSYNQNKKRDEGY